ncbi:MAG: hypothetical protein F4Z06_12910 [Acidimicrobiia bacterium]|nr:hypothetical protein [Acidimicrobiia bacterium]MYE72250.1 hypothetical protein [Acidimicrobiia bacterium]MYJ63084.1 hypothetical protein [Acidimicrobiia bacterium]
MNTARLVRERVANAPERSFVAVADMVWPRHAVECELSRLAGRGEVVRVRKGLYWKGPMTRLGMPLPGAMEVGLAVGGVGAGPAALSAAHLLGLTTQVPATETIAVAGRVPAPVPGVRFVSRSVERRVNELRHAEVAVIEVLRDGPAVVEWPWRQLGEVIGSLASDGGIRMSVVDAELRVEHHPLARRRWAELT